LVVDLILRQRWRDKRILIMNRACHLHRIEDGGEQTRMQGIENDVTDLIMKRDRGIWKVETSTHGYQCTS